MTLIPAARSLRAIVFVAEVLVVGWLLATEDLSSLGFLVACTVVLIVSVSLVTRKWPLGAVALLITSAAMPRITGTVFGLHVHPEHIAIGVTVLAVLLQVANDRARLVPRLATFDYLLLTYVVLNFFSSAFMSPEPSLTVRWATLHTLVIVPYFVLRLIITDEATLHKTLYIVLWVGAVEAAYGIVCFLSNHIFGTVLGMEPEQYGFIPGTYGTQYEANLFGSYTGCCTIMFLAFFLLGDRSRRPYFAWGFGVTGLAAVISLARSVFVAFPIAALVVVWVAAKRGQFKVRTLMPLALGFGLLILAVSPLVLGMIRERFSTIDVEEISADQTTWERVVLVAAAMDDIKAHPTFGTGTASFHLFFDPKDYPEGIAGDVEEGGWISNTPLRVLHDTGVVGLLIFLSFLTSLAITVRKTLKKAGFRTAAAIGALSAGAVLYAITFQASEATMLAFTWLHLGLLAAAVSMPSYSSLA